MPDFTLKSGDQLPTIQAALTIGPTAVDLTTATRVDFIMLAAAADGTTPSGSLPKINAAANIVDAVGGVVRYHWVATDTDTPGNYLAEWEVTWGDGKRQTFPTTTYHSIAVLADLDSD